MKTEVLNKSIDILLVESNPVDVELVRECLAKAGEDEFKLTCAGKLSDTIKHLDLEDYDMVLMDLALPDSYGFNSFISVRIHAPKVPIILLTGIEDEDLAVKAIQHGAQDYLIKGQINGGTLRKSIRFAIERHNASQKQHRLAYFDALTNLPNRQLFHDRLNQALSHSQRYAKKVALMFIDLDDFKIVNDTMGHDMGDLLLQAVARRLECCLRKSDTVARIGGDEFTCILPNIEKTGNVNIVANKIIRALTTPFELKGQKIQISGSVGTSLFPDDTRDSEELIKNADIAMYNAKRLGKSNFQFFAGNNGKRNKLNLPQLLRNKDDIDSSLIKTGKARDVKILSSLKKKQKRRKRHIKSANIVLAK